MATRRAAVRRKTEGVYHHGDLRVALKRAALRLVRERGARGFSLNEASRLAGVTVAAPYRHFADKDALLAELACDGYSLLEKEVREAAALVEGRGAAASSERLVEAGMAYLRFAADHADYFAVMFHAGLDKRSYPEVERSGRQAFDVIRGLCATMRRDADQAEALAVISWALVHGLAVLGGEGALAEVTGDEAGPGVDGLRPVLRGFAEGMAG